MCGQGHRACLHVSTSCQLTRAQCFAKEGLLRPHAAGASAGWLLLMLGWHSRRESAGQAQVRSASCRPSPVCSSLPPKILGKCVWIRDTRTVGHSRQTAQFLHCLKHTALLVTSLILEQRECYKIFLSTPNHLGINGRYGTRAGIS